LALGVVLADDQIPYQFSAEQCLDCAVQEAGITEIPDPRPLLILDDNFIAALELVIN
jgi:hypothetical protein